MHFIWLCPREIYCILFLFRDFLGRFESSTCIGRPRSKVAVAPGAQLERRSHTEASECPVEVITVIKVFSRSLHEAFGSGVISVSFNLHCWDVFPGICGLPLLGNSFSVFVGFKIGPLVVKDFLHQEKDTV